MDFSAVNFADLLIWLVAFLFSVTAHEASHAFIAMKGGDFTAYHGGQVTLNPLPHILRSPFGMLLVPIFFYVTSGFMIGWASAPYDRAWAEQHPRRAAWMALAGPAANFVIFVAALVLAKAGLAAGVFQVPEMSGLSATHIVAGTAGVWGSAAKLLSIFLFLNLLLVVFNLFPFPPLDGGSAVTLLMPQELGQRFTRFISQPMYSLLGLIVAWRFIGVVFRPFFKWTIQLLYGGL